jgi:predicted nucleotidyltransferase
MTPQALVSELQEALGPRLKSVVLYGSAAAGDFVNGRSDFNVLVVAEPLGPEELTALARPSRRWARAGNRPPLLFRPGQLAASVDAFPIELLDLCRSRTVLMGEDPLTGVDVPLGPLRLQLEREWKGKLLNLRERAVLARGRPRRLALLMTATVNSLLVLMRATLRLYGPDVPAGKLDALAALAGHVEFDTEVFRVADAVRHGQGRWKGRDVVALFGSYLRGVERQAEAVDRRGPQFHPSQD